MRLDKADGAAWLAGGGLGLQLGEGGADGIELGTGKLIDVILVCEDVVHLGPDILDLLAQVEVGGGKRQLSKVAICHERSHDSAVSFYCNR